MKLSLYAIVFLFTLFCIQNVEAGYSNNGRMQAKNLNLSVGGTLDNNGELIGTESANLSCDTLSGKGFIRSPQISIETNIFAFTGTIDCGNKCTIISKTPFDEKMFKRKGDGEFVILIENSEKTTDKNSARSMTVDYQITDELIMQVD